MKSAAFAMLLFASAAHANEPAPMPRCADAAAMEAALGEHYGEKLMWSGVARGSQMVTEVYANAVTGTWTLLARTTGQLACLIAVGDKSVNAAGDAS